MADKKPQLIEVKFMSTITLDLNNFPGMTFEMMTKRLTETPEFLAIVNEQLECVALKHID